MSVNTAVTKDTGEQPLPAGISGLWTLDLRKRTREVEVDVERIRRFTTLEVLWEEGIEGLTIDDVHLDPCTDVAVRIMEVLPFDRIELEDHDRETLRYRVVDRDWKLEEIVFHMGSLRRLAADPDRAVKIEYLQRDLLWSILGRRRWVYPSALRHHL